MTFPRTSKADDKSQHTDERGATRYFDSTGREVGQSVSTAAAATVVSATTVASSEPSVGARIILVPTLFSNPHITTVPSTVTTAPSVENSETVENPKPFEILAEIRGLTLGYLDEGDFANHAKEDKPVYDESDKNSNQKPVDSVVSNKPYYFFNQTDLLVTKLLKHVVRGEKKEVKEMLEKDPSLVLYKGQVTDYSGRTIEGTAWQMALGAEDVNRVKVDQDGKPVLDADGKIQILHADEGMAEMIQGYFIKAFNDNEKAAKEEMAKQIKELFPNGYEAYENSEEVKESKANDLKALNEVIEAIKVADVQFTHGDYNNSDGEVKVDAACEAAFNKFREYLNPKGVIKHGKHFNVELLIEAFRLYGEKFNAFGGEWDKPKNVLMWRKVVGYIQRYVPACLAYALCQGLYYVVDDNDKLNRSFKFRFDSSAIFFPLDSDPRSRLGYDYAAWGRAVGWSLFWGRTREGVRRCCKTYVEQKHQSIENLCRGISNVVHRRRMHA